MQENPNQLIIESLIYGIVFIILLVTGLILFFFTTRKKVIEKEIESKVAKIRHQEILMQSIISAQEEERERIARELHDGISSKLNLISLSTHFVLGQGEFSENQKQSLDSILQLSSKTLDESRRIAHDLLPPLLEKFGLFSALEDLIDQYIRHQKIEINFDGDQFEMKNNEEDLHVFRIVQELITNSIRHGKASKVEIITFNNDAEYGFKYSDNGCGFDMDEVKIKSGIGLQNISSRTALISGVYNLYSQKGKGVSFELKMNNEESR